MSYVGGRMGDNRFEHSHSERAILANVLQNPGLFIEMSGRVELDAIKSPVNRIIFEEALRLYNTGYSRFDSDLLVSALFSRDIPDLTSHQIANYVNSLLTADVSAVNFKAYLDDLVDIHMKSRLKTALSSSIDRLYMEKDTTPAVSLLGDIQSELFNIDTNTKREDDPIDTFSRMEEVIYDRINNPNKFAGISSGMPILDLSTLGWLKGRLYFVSARPGQGKSAILMQWALHAALRAGARVLCLDTEMSTEDEFMIRQASHVAAVDGLRLLKGGQLDEKSSKSLQMALDVMKQYKESLLHKYIPGFTRHQVVSLIKKAVYNYGTNLVVFDYFKEPKGGEANKARWQLVGDLARDVKDTLGELGVPGIAALQQNREGEGQSRTNSRALSESDDVLKVADVALMLNWKTAQEIQQETINAGTHRLQLFKGRYTRSIYNGINLRFYGYCFRFQEAPIQQIEEESNDAPGSTSGECQGLPMATADEPRSYV
jgi:replicative DNA helicase